MILTLADGTVIPCIHCGMDMPMLYITPDEPVTMVAAVALFTPERMTRVSCDYGNEVTVYEGFTTMTMYNADQYTGHTMIGFRKESDAV